jgi:hypothetical protein
MESRVSATGLKSVELDELTTDQIIINNEGLQYFHKYTIYIYCYQQSQKDIIIYKKNWTI